MSDAGLQIALAQLIDGGVTSYHVATLLEARLRELGMVPLGPGNAVEGASGTIVRFRGAVAAVLPGRNAAPEAAPLVLAAHTDSPGLVLKLHSATVCPGGYRIPVELYGSPILSTWFDRDLAVAGRAVATEARDTVLEIRSRTPVGIIPSLASHLTPRSDRGREPDPQRDLALLVPDPDPNGDDAPRAVTDRLLRASGVDPASIAAVELQLVPDTPSRFIGDRAPFVVAARLDNLLGCFVNLEVMRRVRETATRPVVALFLDNEEIGSLTASGARGSLFADLVRRLSGGARDEGGFPGGRLLKGLLVSNDAAHALNPNRPDSHDPGYAPHPGKGPAVKLSAAGRYAGDLTAVALMEHAARVASQPLQYYRVRSDRVSGSTVGPMLAAELGMSAVDFGLPILAMHSVRETGSMADVVSAIELLTTLVREEW